MPSFAGDCRSWANIEGKNLVIDQRAAEEQLERLPSILSDLIALRPDVIVAILNSAIAAAQRATSIIPIIMAPGINPIGVGFVRSLAGRLIRSVQHSNLLAEMEWGHEAATSHLLFCGSAV